MYHLDPTYFLYMGPGLVLSLLASWYVKSTFKRFSTVPTARGMTGADVAAAILKAEGIHDVRIEPVDGYLSDHYDPSEKVLRLSPDVYAGRSVSAAGVAAHEVGHAIQHARGYALMSLRQMLVMPARIGSTLSYIVIVAGVVLHMLGLAKVGIALFGAIVLFELVTLPVEINASSRAKERLASAGLAAGEDLEGVGKVLNAAALTYLAALITTVLQLLYYINLVRDRDR